MKFSNLAVKGHLSFLPVTSGTFLLKKIMGGQLSPNSKNILPQFLHLQELLEAFITPCKQVG